MIRILFSTMLIVLMLPVSSWSALSIGEQLSAAVRNNDTARIEALVKSGVKIDSPDDKGVPPLVHAAELGMTDVLFQLIAAGADVNSADRHMRTPLMIAAGKGDTAIVVLLLEAGADPTRKDESGRDAVNYAKSGNAPDEIKTKLLEYSEGRTKKIRTRGGTEPKKYIPVSVYYATNRKAKPLSKSGPIDYTGEPDSNRIHYGVCEVSIPEVHESGELESPSLLSWADPNKHIILQRVTELGKNDFYSTIGRKAGNKEILIFIHGYNVSFNKAARRTAQLAYDLKFDGVPLFFSWPSNGSILKYASDADHIQQSIPAISSFIMDVIDRFKPERIHIIAHSMGTYGLTKALSKLSETNLNKRNSPVFNQLVLAAPDIDAEVFQKEIAPKITKMASRVSLYSSSKDVAMTISRYFNNKRRRAGDSDPETITPKGIDSIDVSSVDSSFVGHSYYGSNTSIITDIKMVLSRKRLDERKLLIPRNNRTTNRMYWFFNPPLETL